ncbi:submandibular gland secretory Glx-rich protein CB-like isoform X4 [Entelurus aequoreus]|uniref:submandibular gland secretory Glx-rich protein CB-like isoform X4 n=1 Tax=Entelurus aequoreus TaxID=161455 RepID=UPI002B1E8D0A|nr:submandibular gland secretory Glx-rich protein CB-like isoform X4 [Entelurus aequoreus]
MCERTIAEYEEELCPTKEEKERQRQLLDAVCKKRQVLSHRTDVQQHTHIKEEDSHPPHVKEDEEEPQPPHIKEEEDEVWITQEEECLLGQEEADLTRFPLTVVSVKTEDHGHKPPESSQLGPSPNICEEHISEQHDSFSRMEQKERQPPQIKEEEEPHFPQIKEEEEELWPPHFKKEGEEPDPPRIKEKDPQLPHIEENEEPQPPHIQEENVAQHPPSMTTEADGDHCGGSLADIAPLSDSDNTTSHSPDTDDDEADDDTDDSKAVCVGARVQPQPPRQPNPKQQVWRPGNQGQPAPRSQAGQ